MSKFWNNLFYHDSNGWWDLPKTQWQEPNPKMEGPFGDGIIVMRRIWDRITASNLLHGTPAFYTMVGAVLSIITLVEVWVFNIQELGRILIPLMLLLSLGKFVLVVAFFMHLRFDRKYYSWVFTACMVLGILMFIAVLVLINYGGQTQQ